MNCCEDFVVENPKPVRAEVIQVIRFRYVVPADKKHWSQLSINRCLLDWTIQNRSKWT